VVPGDDIDLNRAFPGDTRGGWAARAASALWRDISAREPHLLIDLHADAPDAIPYVIVDRPVRRTPGARRLLGDRIASLAEATGLTVLREYPDDVYLQFGLDRSLAGAVVNQLGVPAVTLEVGPRRYQDADAVDLALHATLGALTALGTVDAAAPVHHTRVPGRWRRAAGPRTRRAGLLEPVMRPGQAFARGELLARIKALTGETEEEVRAMEPGLLVSWTESPWLVAGAVVGTVGVADGERL
jgi:predicted deacylase